MTKKDFFIIIIRLFGLYALINVLFDILPINFIYLWEIKSYLIIILSILSILIPIGFFLLLINRTDQIVKILNLDKGFDSDGINLENIDAHTILKIALIIIGGLLLIENLPILIKNVASGFEIRINGGDAIKHIKYNWIVAFIKLILGYLFIFHSNWVAKKLNNIN